MDEREPLTIDLNNESNLIEVDVKLTKGQLIVISKFMSENIQPKGFEMIKFSYDLFKRLNDALESIQNINEEE